MCKTFALHALGVHVLNILKTASFKATTGVSEAHLQLAGKPYVIGLIPSQTYCDGIALVTQCL